MRVLPRFMTAAASAILVLVVVLPARAQSGEEAAVARAVDAFRQAGLSTDSIQFGALLAPELSYGHSNGVVQNKAELIELAMHTWWRNPSISLIGTSTSWATTPSCATPSQQSS